MKMIQNKKAQDRIDSLYLQWESCAVLITPLTLQR